jgi:glutaredoxin 3
MNDHDPKTSCIILYSSPLCGYCAAAKRLLNSKGADFFEINVLFNTERREQMIKLSGRRTVPQIFIGGQHVGGYAELSELDNNGELNTLLAEAV